MSGFHGKFDYSIDSKGRVNIPAKFRKALLPEAAENLCHLPRSRRLPARFSAEPMAHYVAELNSRPETSETLRYCASCMIPPRNRRSMHREE